MTRAEKLKVLQGTLQGNPAHLQQLYRQRRKKSMPYLDAHGIIDAGQCPSELLGLVVMYGEIDEKTHQTTLNEWLSYRSRAGKIKQYGRGTAYGFIDANDSQYDAIALNFTKVRIRNFSYWYLPGNTVGSLRRYYSQSEASFRDSVLVLCFESDMNTYERYNQHAKPA